MNDHQQTSAEIDATLERLLTSPLTETVSANLDTRIIALGSLIGVLESALKVAYGRYYKAVPDPEPFPGAVGDVVRQAIMAVELARKCRLIRELKS